MEQDDLGRYAKWLACDEHLLVLDVGCFVLFLPWELKMLGYQPYVDTANESEASLHSL